MDKTKFRPIGVENDKADNSVIAPVESGTTASQAYAAGAHFIRDSAFCTAKTAIAQGEAFTLNTNYTAGNIANSIKTLESETSLIKIVELTSIKDFNLYTTNGRYYVSPMWTNGPGSNVNGVLEVLNHYGYISQTIYHINSNISKRGYNNGTWSSWKVFS